jgi:enterochelin esterase-like enzyme
MTSGKRQRQQQQREKAQAKVERKAARQASEPEGPTVPVESSEAELMEQLASLHRSIEADAISYQEFEERREQIRQQLEQLDPTQ